MGMVDDLIKYIADITGTLPVIELLHKDTRAKLPLYLTSLFDIRRLRFQDHSLVIAILDPSSTPDLAQITRQREVLAEKLDEAVVLVLPQIKSYERKRLIEKRIPFIVPGRQMYLPMLLLDLRESFPAPTRPLAKTMSWVAQVIVLRHLLLRDMSAVPLSHVAALLGYTPMAISQAVSELAALRLCGRMSVGRERWIQFRSSRREIWEIALPHLRSPVKRCLYARKLDTGSGKPLHSGLTALDERTNIASAKLNTFALSDSGIRAALEDGRMETCQLKEDAAAMIEAWAYMPELLSRGPAVDPLSLYLCFRDDRDERVQMAIEQLLEILE